MRTIATTLALFLLLAPVASAAKRPFHRAHWTHGRQTHVVKRSAHGPIKGRVAATTDEPTVRTDPATPCTPQTCPPDDSPVVHTDPAPRCTPELCPPDDSPVVPVDPA